MSTLASVFPFSTLCESLETIFNLKGINKKTEEVLKLLQNYRNCKNKVEDKTDNSLYPILRLLLPELERERGPHGLREKALSGLYARIFCLGKAALNSRSQAKSRYDHTGEDFADRAYNLIRNQLQNNKSLLSIEQINEFLDNIANKNASNKRKDSIFLTIAKKLSAIEFKWLTRIVLKDLRLGIGQKKILKAFHPNAEELFNVTSNLREICDKLQNYNKVGKPGIKIFYHVKPMLLERYKIENVRKLFEDQSSKYFLQIKYDGERSQIHMKDGRFKYFTRMSHDITKNTLYGESSNSNGFLSKNISRLLNKNCHSLILDGEMMGWHKAKKVFGSKGMTFDVKKLTVNSAFQPCFIAYDLIMHNDELLIDLPYKERLQKLENLFQDEEGIMIKGKSTMVSNSEQVVTFFNDSLDKKEEGIVLKRCDSLYKPNCREGSGCYKIKAEFSEDYIQDIDLIILGGYYGDGRAAGKLRSFLIGVADPPNDIDKKSTQSSKFHSVVSVSSGLNNEQLNYLQKKFELKGQAKCPDSVIAPKNNPPDFWINPEDSIILQVRASEIIRSSFYPIGYTLRFPRVVSVRDDKPWYNTCSSSEFLSFVKDTGIVQKLTKRPARTFDSDHIVPKKIPRQSLPSSRMTKIDDRFLGVQSNQVVRISRCLIGKEICVLNGNEEMTKNEIETLLLAHGASVVQNPRPKTFCVIVGNTEKVKAKNAMENRLYDFVGINWLKRVTDIKNWAKMQDFYPWELLSSRMSTDKRLLKNFDKYYDSFTDDTEEQSLIRTLSKIDLEIKMHNFSVDDFKVIDQDFFPNGSSPFSVFRGFVGYFHNSQDREKFSFEFMAGDIHTSINNFVTHIFTDENNSRVIENYGDVLRQYPHIKIIISQWIADCFKQRSLLAYDNYIVK